MDHNQNNNRNEQENFEDFFNAIVGGDSPANNDNNLSVNLGEISSIRSNNSSFLDNFNANEELFVKRYGKIRELNRTTMSYRIYNLKMFNFEDYYHNFKYMFKGQAEYDYYLIYRDEDWNLYFQVRYQNPKTLTLDEMRECEFLKSLNKSNVIDIMENDYIEDVKVGNNIIISFTSGPLLTAANCAFTQKIFQYCRKKGINLW